MPDLSLTICSRNRARKLQRCLAAIRADEMREVSGELVLVDNGSQDETFELMEIYASKALFPVTIVKEPTVGLSHARNAGIAKAVGTTVVFTDDDCYLGKGYLTRAAQLFESNEFQYCGGQIWLYDKTDAEIAVNYCEEKFLIEPHSFIRAGTIQGSNMIFHRRVIETVGAFDTMFGLGTPFACEDIDYAARASWAGFTGAHIPELVVHHHHGRKPGRATSKYCLGYSHGAGAYHAKHILEGRPGFLSRWFEFARIDRESRDHLVGASKYLATRLRARYL